MKRARRVQAVCAAMVALSTAAAGPAFADSWSSGAPVGDRAVAPAEPTDAVASEVPSADGISTAGGANVRHNIFHENGEWGGAGYWSQDPGSDFDRDGKPDPGDAILAYDSTADGWGVETWLTTGRTATTRGHSAPYMDWATGNLPEGGRYLMQVCLVRGAERKCDPVIQVTA